MIRELFSVNLSNSVNEKLFEGYYKGIIFNYTGDINGNKSVDDIVALLPDIQIDFSGNGAPLAKFITAKPKMLRFLNNAVGGNVKATATYDGSSKTTFDIDIILPFNIDERLNNALVITGRDSDIIQMISATGFNNISVKAVGLLATEGQKYLPAFNYQTIEQNAGGRLKAEIFGVGQGTSMLIMEASGDTNPYLELETETGLLLAQGHFKDLSVLTNYHYRLESNVNNMVIIEFDLGVSFNKMNITYKPENNNGTLNIYSVSRWFTPNRYKMSKKFWDYQRAEVLNKLKEMMSQTS